MVMSGIDYQWLPGRQKTALESCEKARPQASPLRGFTVDGNGDWLLLSGGFRESDGGGNTLWRSGDKGENWHEVGRVPRLDEQNCYAYGCNSLLVTGSGRILTACVRRPADYASIPHRRQKRRDEVLCVVDDPPGRELLTKPGFLHSNQGIYVACSDDGGKTWLTTGFIDTTPLHSAYVDCCGPMAQAPGGDIILPFAAWLEEGSAYGWNMCGCYVTSRDQGGTWDRPIIVARGEDARGQWYNETAVLPRKDQPWIAVVRMNPMFRKGKPSGHCMLAGYRCFSHDRGATWTLPEPIGHTVAYPVLRELLDGSVLFAASHWAASYMFLSCDHGRSWSYGSQVPLSGGDAHHWMQPDEDTLVVGHKDITHQRVLLTWFSKQPTTKSIPVSAPRIPQHRWTMRDLKNIRIDEHLKPYCTSVRSGHGTVLVGGVSAEREPQVFVISSTDAGASWCDPRPVCRARRYANICPGCLTALDDTTLMMLCTESDRPEHAKSPTLLRTLLSSDCGKNWREVARVKEIDGLSAVRPGAGIVEDDAGRLVLPISGIDGTGRSICGLVYSRSPSDDWALFDRIAAAPEPDDILDQPAVLPLADGRWLTFFTAHLAEYRTEHANAFGKTFRQPPLWQATSNDRGKTWTSPAPVCSAHHPHAVRLPDGGLMLTSIVASTLRYQVSYNDGVSWSFENGVISYPDQHLYAGTYSMSGLSAVVLDDLTVLGIYFCDDSYEGGPRIAATWIRALPAESPEARERGL